MDPGCGTIAVARESPADAPAPAGLNQPGSFVGWSG